MGKWLVLGMACAALGVAIATPSAEPSRPNRNPTLSRPAPRPSPLAPRTSTDKALIEEYCLECHDADKAKGDLVLEDFDPAKPDERADVAEKIVR